jgi:hypothetical protein
VSPDAIARWSALLDRLEADLELARAGRPLGGWQPPAAMPPLPAVLADRARALRRAQTALGEQTAAERGELLRRIAAARRNARADTRPGPVYLDAVG